METTFQESVWKIPEIYKWTYYKNNNQLDIKLGQFMPEELDEVLKKKKKIKNRNAWWNTPRSMENKETDDILLQYCNAIYNQNTIDGWTKGSILPFPKKGDHRIANNYQGITLTNIVAKISNALLLNRIDPEIEKKNWKNQNGFWRNQSTTSQIRRILEVICVKILEETLLFVDFSKAFDSIHRGKMEQILLAYSLPKETVAAIMMLYKKKKSKSSLSFFDIVAGVLQGDTSAPYLFIIYLDYMLRNINRFNERKWLYFGKGKKQMIPHKLLRRQTTLMT